MIRTVVRRSRRDRPCHNCGAHIAAGDLYRYSTCTPNHEGVTQDGWSQLTECAACCDRYGRPIPKERA